MRHGVGPGHHGRGGFSGGPGGPWWARRGGPGGPGPRFGRGDLKYELLALLAERPMHGYEMIKALEEQSGGFYTPSAGAVYPSLQLMEDRGWITSQTVDGKKVYTITDAGREALAQQRGAEEHRPSPFGGWQPGRGPGWFGRHGHRGREASPELLALGQESREVTMLLFNAVMSSGGDPAKLARLREIVANARRALREYIDGADGGAATTRLDPEKGRGPDDLI
jgi:DNA-binding PadR family transcriptional regulator